MRYGFSVSPCLSALDSLVLTLVIALFFGMGMETPRPRELQYYSVTSDVPLWTKLSYLFSHGVPTSERKHHGSHEKVMAQCWSGEAQTVLFRYPYPTLTKHANQQLIQPEHSQPTRGDLENTQGGRRLQVCTDASLPFSGRPVQVYVHVMPRTCQSYHFRVSS